MQEKGLRAHSVLELGFFWLQVMKFQLNLA